jgi:hypothetical protein
MRLAQPTLFDDNELTGLLRRFEPRRLHYATRILGDCERAGDIVREMSA